MNTNFSMRISKKNLLIEELALDEISDEAINPEEKKQQEFTLSSGDEEQSQSHFEGILEIESDGMLFTKEANEE